MTLKIFRGGAAVVGACLVLLLGGCSPKTELLGALPEAEANEVLAALLNAGMVAEKRTAKDGVTITVARDDVARAVDLLRAQGLPRERFDGMGDIFRKEGLISSPVEERARFLYALSQELSNTISRIDGVLSARVHLVLPERSSGSDPSTPSSAAVFIKHRADVNLDAVQPQVRRLVSNSIPGLAGDKVSIILVPSHVEPVLTQIPAMADVLGFRVEAGSATALTTTLVVLALLALGGLGGAAWLAWQHILLPRRTTPARAEPVEAQP